MKNVLVTGAAGFLGSHLARHHLERGDNVLGLDDFCSSDEKSQHLRDLCAFERFSFVECDITQPKARLIVDGWNLRNGDVDLVYNFACPASPPKYQEMPIHTMMTCVVGTEQMLKLAEDNDAVLVHASTSEVYGDPDCSPQPETYRGLVNSYGPRACYDEGKRAAEALCFDYRNMYGVDARLVRIFNTYGPHMDPYDGRVISNFIRQALQGEPLTVYGTGRQSRSFCYVDDLIRGIVALGALAENPKGPINLGNPNEYAVQDIAVKIISKTESKSTLTYEPLPVDDPTQRCPDISRAKTLLGWEPRVMLEEGLDRTVAYFRRVVKA